MVTSIARAQADPFARNPTTSSCLIWSSHIPSFPQLVSIIILPSVALMSTLFCVFTFIDMAFPYPSDTQSDMCGKKNVKQNLPRPKITEKLVLPPPTHHFPPRTSPSMLQCAAQTSLHVQCPLEQGEPARMRRRLPDPDTSDSCSLRASRPGSSSWS